MRNWRVTMFGVLSSATLASCGTTTMDFAATSSSSHALGRAAFCDVARPISWSRNDTDQTILQVKEHNAVGQALCAWAKAPVQSQP